MIISDEQFRENDLTLQGWEWSAWRAFYFCNQIRDTYVQMGRAKWVQLSHNFYDLVYRIREEDMLRPDETKATRFVEKSVHMKKETSCIDHPFSSRAAFRAIMLEHQYILDDFETFKVHFYTLATSTLSVSSSTNERVKLVKDGQGDLIVPKIITERYVNKDGSPITFYDKVTKNYVHEFPLPIPPFYLEYEKKRVPNNLEAFGV